MVTVALGNVIVIYLRQRGFKRPLQWEGRQDLEVQLPLRHPSPPKCGGRTAEIDRQSLRNSDLD